MSTKDNGLFRELKADELEKVSGSGGFIFMHYPQPPVGPALPPPLPISGGTGGGGGGGGGGGDGGGGSHPN